MRLEMSVKERKSRLVRSCYVILEVREGRGLQKLDQSTESAARLPMYIPLKN